MEKNKIYWKLFPLGGGAGPRTIPGGRIGGGAPRPIFGGIFGIPGGKPGGTKKKCIIISFDSGQLQN